MVNRLLAITFQGDVVPRWGVSAHVGRGPRGCKEIYTKMSTMILTLQDKTFGEIFYCINHHSNFYDKKPPSIHILTSMSNRVYIRKKTQNI